MPSAARGVVNVNALVFAAIGVGLLNNILIAGIFGLTRRVDAFFAAAMLPSLFMVLCIDYLGKNFLPVFASAKQEGEESASRMTSTIVTSVAMLAVAVSAILFFSAEPVFTLLLPGFSSEEVALVADYFRIMAPAIVLMAVNAFHEYVCQYEERFTKVVAIRAALPFGNLLAIIALGPYLGEYCLPVGYLAGHTIVFLLMARAARYRYVPSIQIRAHLERRVFVNSAILMSTGLIARTKSIVTNALASTLGGGAIAALAFALKLTEPLERAAFTGARMFMFSRTARMFVEQDRRGLGRLYESGLRVSFLLVAPVVWWVVMNSEFIVGLLFARGEFTPQMSALVAGVLVALVPSVLFAGMGALMSNAFYAMDRVRAPAIVMPCGMLVYVALAVALVEPLGTQGLALATSVTTLVTFSALFVWLSLTLEDLPLWRTALNFFTYMAASGALMGVVTLVLTALGAPAWGVAVAGAPLGAGLYLAVLRIARDRAALGVERFAREVLAGNAPA